MICDFGGLTMLCQDIIKILEAQSPSEYALEWDNVGLLVGRKTKDIKRILIAVDATLEVCQKAIDENIDMIITHHPMIFSKIKKINDDTVVGKKIMSLIEKGVVCYAMHTNFDTKGGMAREAASMLKLKNSQVLEETLNGEGIGQIGLLDTNLSLKELAELTKEQFGLKNVIVYGDLTKKIEKVAISPGSGKSVIQASCNKKADCLITGDIGHHDGIDAMEMGLTIIDASHYGIEKIFMNYMYNYLKGFCPDVDIEVANEGEPFQVI